MINISNFTYELPEERIAKFPLEFRDRSKLLIYNGKIEQDVFYNIHNHIEPNRLIVVNNTKVVRARLIFLKETGARIEIFCLEPHAPADYERAFSVKGSCSWHCIIGNAKRFKEDLCIDFGNTKLIAKRGDGDLVYFKWNGDLSFGQLLESLGRVPIPPYLRRESEELDNDRYQTTYAYFEGSVAAPTAGLHFTEDALTKFNQIAKVTLHVGAGTFLPVKELDAEKHVMHTEHFAVDLSQLMMIANNQKNIVAVGTTSVRTLESLAILGQRVQDNGSPNESEPIGQWEAYQTDSNGKELKALVEYMQRHKIDVLHGATQIMITPKYVFRTIAGLITNFHQPQSTLLLLISAVVGSKWREIYTYAMSNNFRFLSYGDSSLLMCQPKSADQLLDNQQNEQ